MHIIECDKITDVMDKALVATVRDKFGRDIEEKKIGRMEEILM